MGDAALDSTTGHPEREACGVVVAAVLFLDVRRAPELATPDDQRVLEHIPLLQILEESCDGLIDRGTVGRQLVPESSVLIPVGMREFDEADSCFGQSTRQQTLSTEIVGALAVDAVTLERGF